MVCTITSDDSTWKEIMHHQVDEHHACGNPMVSHTGQRLVLRDMIKDVAKYIRDSTPYSREQSLALTKLDEAEMWANKANERPDSC